MRYAFNCIDCQHTTDHDCKYEDRPEQIVCENCGKMASYKLIPPMPMLKSYLDGSSRFRDLKEASKLNVAAARTDNADEKAAIKKEIARTGYKFEK